jgi:hypothetical protein
MTKTHDVSVFRLFVSPSQRLPHAMSCMCLRESPPVAAVRGWCRTNSSFVLTLLRGSGLVGFFFQRPFGLHINCGWMAWSPFHGGASFPSGRDLPILRRGTYWTRVRRRRWGTQFRICFTDHRIVIISVRVPVVVILARCDGDRTFFCSSLWPFCGEPLLSCGSVLSSGMSRGPLF